jgi:hypothetical protein
VRATGAAGDLAVIELVIVPLIYNNNLAGNAAGEVAVRWGKTITEGHTIVFTDEDVVMDGSTSNALTLQPAIGTLIRSVQANLETVITATTAVKVGIGTATTTADPDKYGKTSALTQNLKVDTIPDWAVLSAIEELGVFAVDTNGAAAGTLDTGTVRVVVRYEVLDSLDDA